MIEKIDFSQSEQYTLSIRLSTDGFSFSIYNPLNGSDFFFHPYPVNTQRSMAANAKAFLAETEELKRPFKQVNILIHSERYTVLPFELYEDEQMKSLFYQNLQKVNNETVLCNILGKSNTVILFGLDKLTHLFFSEHFPTARFFAAVSPQIEYFSVKSRLGNNRKLYANLHPESVDLFAFDRGHPLLFNTFSASGVTDQCYYLLYAWKQLGYDQERDELHLTGQTPFRKEITEQLQQYIRKVFIINPQAEFNDSESSRIENVPFDIQSLIACE